MGTTNEKAVARSAETQLKSVGVAGSGGLIGRESELTRNQQERDCRANSSESSIFSTGTAVTGGMLDHLIDEYCDQMAAKQDEIQRIENEVNRLRSRVQEFKALREELKRQSEEE